ncbi:hypothetical protein BKA64DRAFT_645106 [Cadophora sp. MPI-SDFR-AT-0126]|nr:hypothetical protein BKA64DRAFT_645106 [Leotiomycetes sp. MPI-SDFR-AT-0126]
MSTVQTAKRSPSPSSHHVSQSPKRKRLSRAGEWIKREKAWKDWISDEAVPPVLWIHGPPGCGKSYLAKYIISELEGLDDSKDVISFFCEETSTPQSFAEFLLDYFNHEVQPRTSEDTRQPLLDPFVAWDQILNFVQQSQRCVILVLDGLDEMLEKCRDFDLPAKLITLVVGNPTKVKLLLSSRPEPRILRRVRGFGDISITAALVEEDLDLFIDSEINSYPKLAPHLGDLASPIKIRSEGIFLWAKLYIKNLDATAIDGFKPELDETPGLLDDVYAQILETSSKELDPHEIDLRNTVLRWLVTQIRPLSETELANVISIETNMLLGNQLRPKIQEVCASLLKDDVQNSLQLMHYSVREFLQRQNTTVQNIPEFSTGKAHAALATTCLSYLSHPAFDGPNEQMREKRGKDYGEGLYRLLEYSSLYWVYHISNAESSPELCQSIRNFFTTQNAFAWVDHFLPMYLERSVIQPPPRPARTAAFMHLFTMKSQLVKFFDESERTDFDKQLCGFLAQSYELAAEEARSHSSVEESRLFGRLMDLAELYGWLPNKALDPFPLLKEASELASTPADRAEVLQALADYYKRDGKYETAQSHLEDLISEVKDYFSSTDKRYVFAYDSLGWVCMRLNKLDEAAKYLNQALKIAVSNYGSTSPYTLRSKVTLAEVLSKLGRVDEAEVLCKDLIAQVDEHREMGIQLPKDSISQLNTLAAVYMQQGKFNDAINTYQTVVEDRTKVFGDSHRMTLWATMQLGIAKQAGGLLKEAAELFEVLLPKQIKELGEEHPDVKESRTRMDALKEALRGD